MGPKLKLISLKEERSKLDLCLLACMNRSDKQSERADHVKSCFCLLAVVRNCLTLWFAC